MVLTKGAVILIATGVATAGILHQFDSGGTKQNPQGKKKGQGQGKGQGRRAYPPAESAWDVGSIILGNATNKSMGMTIHANQEMDGFIEYWSQGQSQKDRSQTSHFGPGQPIQLVLSYLKPDTSYAYHLSYKKSGTTEFVAGPDYHFQTQRPAGEPYMFFVQGDSHPERMPKMNVPALYERILKTAAEQKPDFFICLGDDFSVDTLQERTPETVEGVYKKQVPYLALVGNSAPIYLVNGNHEQASMANLDGTANSVSVLAQNARNRNFLEPAPDDFYTGDGDKVDHIGLLRNYHAWTWGDALFVTIDPYWHSKVPVDNPLGKGPKEEGGGGKRNRNMWDVSLGDNQYKWLKKTLESSKAKFKFVFAHHVLGTGRGGIEEASLYEWGGMGRSGANEFKQMRPNMEMPIHQLFVKNGVSIFFQGHDHIFCKQELDGVIYQSCPVPADATNELINGDAYQSGDKLVGAGLLRVSVGPQKAKIEFVRSFLPDAELAGHKHGEIAYSYEVKPRIGSGDKK